MNFILQLHDAFHIVCRSVKTHLFGLKKYSGSILDISEEIIRSCYNKKRNYFMVSTGNFNQFYARDFGMIIESLLNLGYKDKVKNTLIYALEKYSGSAKITTQISSFGVPLDFPNHTPESTAYMLRSLILIKDKSLLKKYKSFFEERAKFIFDNDINKKTGLLRSDKYFSSMKDHSLRISDCYLNSMLGLLSLSLNKAKYKNPFKRFNYKKILMNNFWNGNYFVEDLSGNNIVSGDANTFPFWTGIITDKKIFYKVLKAIKYKGLDSPFPLKYTSKEDVPKKMGVANLFVPGYEEDTIWMHLGLCYLKVVEKYDEKLLKKYLGQYGSLIKKYNNFLEVYFANGAPFKRPLYYVDDSMSWVAIFLELYKKYF